MRVGSIPPTPRCNSISRLDTGHPNTLQLQNYLRQMSRSRRVLERIHSNSYDDSVDTPHKPPVIHKSTTPVSVEGWNMGRDVGHGRAHGTGESQTLYIDWWTMSLSVLYAIHTSKDQTKCIAQGDGDEHVGYKCSEQVVYQ